MDPKLLRYARTLISTRMSFAYPSFGRVRVRLSAVKEFVLDYREARAEAGVELTPNQVLQLIVCDETVLTDATYGVVI